MGLTGVVSGATSLLRKEMRLNRMNLLNIAIELVNKAELNYAFKRSASLITKILVKSASEGWGPSLHESWLPTEDMIDAASLEVKGFQCIGG